MSAKKARRNQPAPSGADLAAQTLDSYRPLLHPDEFAAMLEALQKPLPQAVRVNTLKISAADALQVWPARYGWQVSPVPFCPAGWQINAAEVRPSHTPEFKLGFFYIQDAASMLPVELFDFDDLTEPLTLELAAAPGGKSTHLASRTWDRGLFIANDSSHGRIPALRAALQDWGAMNSVVTGLPGEKFGAWFPDTFDRVLLDAPCSMENLRPGGGHAKRVVSPRERQSLAQRQVRLLDSAFEAARPGGQIVYSTCTLAPEEDEGVIDALLRMHPGLLEVVEVTGRLPAPAYGLPYHGERDFLPEVQRAVRLWPHLFETAGFFSARLRKLDSLGQSAEPHPRYTFEKHGFNRMSGSAQAALLRRLEELYGVDLSPLLDAQRLRLWERAGSIFALPELFVSGFASLPVESLGFLIVDENRDGLVPSHELVARFGLEFTRGRVQLGEAEARRWLNGEDLLDLSAVAEPLNTVVAVTDEPGRLLGRGKVLRDRLKNMLPRRLI